MPIEFLQLCLAVLMLASFYLYIGTIDDRFEEDDTFWFFRCISREVELVIYAGLFLVTIYLSGYISLHEKFNGRLDLIPFIALIICGVISIKSRIRESRENQYD